MHYNIFQFSDIHFKKTNNSLDVKSEELFNAIKNKLQEKNLILITGDSAFSGRNVEFFISRFFFRDLIRKLINYKQCEIDFLVIPGNHDCQDLNITNPVRKALLNNIKSGSEIEIEIVEQINGNLDNYYRYENSINGSSNLIYSNPLVKVYSFDFNNKNILYYCYNTAFQSVLHETPSTLVFPLNLLDQEIFKLEADLIISCFHHPLHWLTPDHNRAFNDHIQSTSDFYFTGHEHIQSNSRISDLENNVTYHIEGDVLQDNDNTNNSGFKLVTIDLEQQKFSITNFNWNGTRFTEKNNSWNVLEKGNFLQNPFQISNIFIEELEDAGANFAHPNIANLQLSDFYIFPNIELINKGEAVSEDVVSLTCNSETILDTNLQKACPDSIRMIFSGGENVGKTSLVKQYYKKLHRGKLFPIYLEGQIINSTNISELNKLLEKNFLIQYQSEDEIDFSQIDNHKLVIIIDDFNKVKLNIKYKAKLIENLINNFDHIIITGNELTSIEDIIIEDNKVDLYSSFDFYEIIEFGYKLRSKLINNWNILGVEDKITDEERFKKLQYAESVINTVLGVNYVPSYPFFILTILQTLELGNPTDLSASTFGYYYHFLIQKSFVNVLKSQREITEYENYLSELAFYIFGKSLKEFDEYLLEDFDKEYRKKFTISHRAEKIKNNLLNSKIFSISNGSYEFKYSYIYYYFLSAYLAGNIEDEDVRDYIKTFTQQLYITEYSNILMFITHHSKSKFLLEQILEKTKVLFNELEPCKLEEDIKTINELGIKINDIVYETQSIDEYREQDNDYRDENERISDIEVVVDANPLANKEIKEENEITIVSNLNTAFKTIEIIGQILKNNYGKIDNTTLEKLIEGSMLLGLRTLNVFFQIIEENSEFIINQVNSIISEIEQTSGKKLDNPKRIEKLSKDTLFRVCYQMSYTFIKKISSSIGNEYLNDILEKVYSQNQYNSVKLIKLSSKLEYYSVFPESDIKQLKPDLEKHYLSYIVMKRLVINHLYLFPTNYKQKDKILGLLNIPVRDQLKIDQTSRVKKKSKIKKKD